MPTTLTPKEKVTVESALFQAMLTCMRYYLKDKKYGLRKVAAYNLIDFRRYNNLYKKLSGSSTYKRLKSYLENKVDA